MLAFRTIQASAALLPKVGASRPSAAARSSFREPQSLYLRSFSSTSDNDSPVLTGKVKFYLRDKSYGFILPDGGDTSEEIWVHRTSLDTPHSPEEFPTRPYLLRDEKVQFQVEHAEGQSNKAVKVRFANGRQVPLFRKNYHASVVRGEMHRLGEAVFDILKNSDNLSDEECLEQIKAARAAAEENIENAAEKQQQFGPEPDEMQ